MNTKNKNNWINLKNNWWKILAIAFLGSLFNVLVHGILPSGESVLQPSVIVQQGFLPLAFLIYGLVYYVLLGCIFVLIQERLKGSKLVKGFTYGIFFCILTFIVYFEPLPNTATLSFTNMAWMLGDGIPFVVLGVLLGLFLAKDAEKEMKLHKSPKKSINSYYSHNIPYWKANKLQYIPYIF